MMTGDQWILQPGPMKLPVAKSGNGESVHEESEQELAEEEALAEEEELS